jgi:ABC-type lipoprotein export system ATPase subunit
MAGLELPEAGQILAFGREMASFTKNDFAMYHRAQVGMIYQQYNLITSLTVLDNVALPQIFVNVRKGKRNKWGRALLQRFGILKQAKKIPSELSGGQQQRIGIARAIVNNPKLVLADEPVGNLDSISAKNVLDILEALNEKEKKTVVLVTHNPEYLNYGDRIIYMKDGIITREVINRDKRKGKVTEKVHKVKSTAAELEDLMRAYHGLAPEQINILIMPYKAKAFAHHFISSRNLEETKILEEVIQRRLMGTISQEEFFDTLHKSSIIGGVGFDIRTAEKIIRRVNRIIRTAYFVYQQERPSRAESGEKTHISDDDKAQRLADYLLRTCYHKYAQHLDEVQTNRIKQAIKDRMAGTIRKPGFFDFLDRPFKDGGVGLNRKTARAMTEELELILILGFGIVQTTKPEGARLDRPVEKPTQSVAPDLHRPLRDESRPDKAPDKAKQVGEETEKEDSPKAEGLEEKEGEPSPEKEVAPVDQESTQEGMKRAGQALTEAILQAQAEQEEENKNNS